MEDENEMRKMLAVLMAVLFMMGTIPWTAVQAEVQELFEEHDACDIGLYQEPQLSCKSEEQKGEADNYTVSGSSTSTQWLWPVEDIYTMSRGYFYYSSENYHNGIDISGSGILGHTVRAAKSGVVIASVNECGHTNYGNAYGTSCFHNQMGNHVKIRHDDGTTSIYMHLQKDSGIALGTRVEQGDYVGKAGSSGYSTGPHLHFQAWDSNGNIINTNPTDPRHTFWGNHTGTGISYVYTTHTHSWNNVGKCECGVTYDYEATMTTEFNAYYTVTKYTNIFSTGFYPRKAPYDASEKYAEKLKKGTVVKVIGMGPNALSTDSDPHIWYKIQFGGPNHDLNTGYAYSTWIEYKEPIGSSISVNVTWPCEGSTIPRKSETLLGMVTSSIPLWRIEARVDGKCVAKVSTNKTSYSLSNPDIDFKVKFNEMDPGPHTLTFIVTDSNYATRTFNRHFITAGNYSLCEPAIVTHFDTNGGQRVKMKCDGAYIKYYTDTGLSGSGNNEVEVTITQTTKFTITTSKSGKANNVKTETINVDAVMPPQFSAVEWSGGTRITITSTPGASIYYRFEGTQYGEYVGPFNETRDITVYAVAYKDGMRNSEETSFHIRSVVPQTPTVQRLNTESKMAVGKTASFKWNSDSVAKEYVVRVYKDGTLINTEVRQTNVYSMVLGSVGVYEVEVKARNDISESSFSSRVSVTAMGPSTVTFCDDDGSILAVYTVAYGDYVGRQSSPSHKGHYFSGWYPSNNYYEIPVTQNVTYTATYSPIVYNVIFYDVDGVKLGDTQRIPYQQSATPPDYSAFVPGGYVFVGWTVIEASDNESACDYTCVDANLKLQAVIRWANNELPVYTTITSASVTSVDGESVYTVAFKATNWPNSASSVYFVAALKVQDPSTGVYKTAFSDRVMGSLSAGKQNAEFTIDLHYDGVAKRVELYALERKADGTTGSAYSAVVSASVVFSTSWTNWSAWSTTQPASQSGRTIETKTQYKYQTKEYTTGSSSTMSGWTQYDSSWAWSSWGSWSSWQDASVASSDSVSVQTRTVYAYYWFQCPSCGAHMHGWGITCPKWAGGCGNAYIPESSWHILWSTTAHSQVSFSDWHGTGKYYAYVDGTLVFKWQDGMDRGEAVKTQYRYCTRSKVWTYYFYRWTAWSDWSDTPVTANSNRNVDTRTLYRYRDIVENYSPSSGSEDPSGTVYTFEGTIGAEQDLTGKIATVMVYQSNNMDPNQYQTKYVGQITIQSGNHYVISFIPNSDPTIESGNFVVALGVQGTTGLINVGLIEAPKREYVVRFLSDDGTVLSTQVVAEGDNAVVPEIPVKEGYRFIGWSNGSTDIYKNVDIVAQFEKNQYMVAFVDWANQAIGFQMYYYGDTITAPYNPEAEGRTFLGWDAILNGNTTVTDNMIVEAVYDVAVFTVRFMDGNGNAVSVQEVEYGGAAVLPEGVEAEGKVFLGWSTDVMWWNVTADMDVEPILAYEETTMSPMANTDSYIIGLAADIELTSEEGAVIYYTTDGTPPTTESLVYDGGIYLEETAMISAMAVVEGKNESEVINIFFVYDDTPVEEWMGTLQPLDYKVIEAEAELEVPITVELSNNPGLIGYTLVLECDRSIFYIDCEDEGPVCVPGSVSEEGEFYVSAYGDIGWKITWLSSEPISSDGVLFTIPLKVGEEAEAGTYGIRLGYIEGEAYSEETDRIEMNAEMVHFAGSALANAVQFTVDEVSTSYGCDAAVSLSIDGEYEANALTVCVTYDAEVLALSDLSMGEVWIDMLEQDATITVNTDEAGCIRLVANIPAETISSTGTLFTMNFHISGDVELGTDLPITVEVSEFFVSPIGGSDIPIPYAATNGVIHVNAIPGDVNGDKTLSASDVILIIRYALNIIDLEPVQIAAADYNKDGEINASDALLLMRKCLGII